MKLTENELKEVLRLHRMWLDGESGGKKADLCYVDLRGTDLRGADLRDAKMHKVNLHCVNLYCANLCSADLSNADLSWTNLYGANLSYADLSWTNLRSTVLCNSSLHGANLYGANLSHADLSCADLSGAKCGYEAFFGRATGAPIYQAVCGFGSRNATLTLLAQGERTDWRWFTGCFEGSEKELRKAVIEKHGGSKEGRCYLRAIDYLIEQAEDNKNKSE